MIPMMQGIILYLQIVQVENFEHLHSWLPLSSISEDLQEENNVYTIKSRSLSIHFVCR